MSRAVCNFNEDELVNLLTTSRTNNEILEVTGMLLYSQNKAFIQVLEGPADNVNMLLKKIAQDPRHEQIEELISLPINERSFPNWKMGFQRLNQSIDYQGFSNFMETAKDNRIVNHSNNFSIDMLNYFKVLD